MDDVLPTAVCVDCGAHFTSAQSSGDICFRCKVTSVGFGWRGPTSPTRADFHNNTIRGVIEEGNRNIIDNGGDPKKDFTFTGNRWI